MTIITHKARYCEVLLHLNPHNQREESTRRKSQAEGLCSWTDHSIGCLGVNKKRHTAQMLPVGS